VRVSLLRNGRNFVEIAARHGRVPESIVTISTVVLRVEYGA